jgi:hypothetical protein
MISVISVHIRSVYIPRHEANKGNLRPKHHVYAVDYYSSVVQGLPMFIKCSLLEYPLKEWMMIP